MLNIYIARHGQDVDNARGILNGHRNNPLTDIGTGQAKELAEHIKQLGISFEVVYSSPLLRAHKTAEIVAKKIGAKKPVKHPLLIERNFGKMTGELVKDIEKLCSPSILKTEIITYFIEVEGAETFPEMIKRAGIFLAEINKKHKDGSILLVCHGDIGKMIYASFYGLDWVHVLKEFHFGNSELLLVSSDRKPENAHVFKLAQHNH